MRSISRALSLVLLSLLASCGPGGPHALSTSAYQLAMLPSPQYENVQLRWQGTREAACNYFVLTAICEAGGCASETPKYSANDFEIYLRSHGWKEVGLLELKSLLTGAGIDAILQRDGNPGHVSIPIKLDSDGEIIVAQGELGGATHELSKVSDAYLTSQGFRAWVK